MVRKHDFIIEKGQILMREYRYTKAISIENFAKEILRKKTLIETDQLPTNCVKYARTKTIQKYYIHISEDYYKLIYNDALYTIRLPHTIFIFTFEAGSISLTESIKISWTTDEKLNLDNETFFIPPMMNVHHPPDTNGKPMPTAHSMCINLPRDAEKQHDFIEQFIDIFFKTSFNDDISAGKKKIDQVATEQKDMLAKGYEPHDLIQAWWKPYKEGKLADNNFWALNQGALR